MRHLPLFLLIALVVSCSGSTDTNGSLENADPAGVPEEGSAPAQVDEPTVLSSDFLVRVFEGEEYELGAPCGYQNQQGDMVIPIGKFGICWTDTIQTFGIIADEALTRGAFFAINLRGEPLFEVYTYDNGPDFIEEGLFRMVNDGKIGYADASGNIQIEPQFACAEQFKGGVAKVALDCDLVPDGEYKRMESEAWFYIDTKGKKVTKKE